MLTFLRVNFVVVQIETMFVTKADVMLIKIEVIVTKTGIKIAVIVIKTEIETEIVVIVIEIERKTEVGGIETGIVTKTGMNVTVIATAIVTEIVTELVTKIVTEIGTVTEIAIVTVVETIVAREIAAVMTEGGMTIDVIKIDVTTVGVAVAEVENEGVMMTSDAVQETEVAIEHGRRHQPRNCCFSVFSCAVFVTNFNPQLTVFSMCQQHNKRWITANIIVGFANDNLAGAVGKTV
jgi:hypothetical protein